MHTASHLLIARLAVGGLGALVILCGMALHFAFSPPLTHESTALPAFVLIGYGILLLLPPRLFTEGISFWFCLFFFRAGGCAWIILLSARLIWSEAYSITSLALLLLLPGVTFCLPGALSVWELFHARPNAPSELG